MNDNVKKHRFYHQVPTLDFRRLKVVSALGRGAKGVVFLVNDQELSEFLALKVIQRDLIEKKSKDSNNTNDGEDDYKRFTFEQQVLQSFDHPLLPRLRGVLSTDKIIGYAIDYCPGRDMNSLRKKQTEKMFSDDTIRFYAAEMVLALEYLHSQGIAYRDLKPENIMIQENGHIMLVDFDLSTKLSPKTPQASTEKTPASFTKRPSDSVRRKRRHLFHCICNAGISPEDSVSSAQHSFKTVPKRDSDHSTEKSNSFVGTEEYVAPEIISGEGHDFSADWWSLGIVLHEMLYGVTPFKGSNRKETFYRILCRPAELMGEPTPLRDLIRKLLEKDPTKRIGVEEIKGHDFFRGLDWDLLLNIARAPYIPPSQLGNTNNDGGLEGIKEIDVEWFVQEIFPSSDEGDKRIVNKTVRSNGSNDQLPGTDYSSVF
ncbi:serine/threonine-protein kinase OXI1-like [Mangifera indica]|uniref:serine/threonine-protein kinase OXI1-like n=1 Tax=Mangifera indica TaxID=29780 RepID=UPI001CFAB207|nr:serine/threonine-protein kinase OXI1-like [Mangifera indica]